MVKKSYCRIILAEDDSGIREIMTEILTSAGHDVTAATDGHEAKEFLEKENFDLLISDYSMPRVNGGQLVKWCRETDRTLPVIFISADSELLTNENSPLIFKDTSFLPKPIDIDALFSTIDTSMAKDDVLE